MVERSSHSSNDPRSSQEGELSSLDGRAARDISRYSRSNYGRSSSAESHDQYARGNTRYSSREARKSQRGRKIKLGVAAVLAAVVVAFVAAFSGFIGSVDEELNGNKTPEELAAIDAVLPAYTNNSKPFYMLLLGSDARSNNKSMGARADTSIVARVDPQTNTVTLLSIPRDTMIYIDGEGPYKFNAAYSLNGTAGTIEAANELLGIKISHYAEVNFETLVDLVDAVGGVEVDVPARINDSKAGNIAIEPGLQTLDGKSALVFARSRQYVDGDFTRASNQRLLIEALAKKILSLPIDQMPTVVKESARCVTTDMSITEIGSLALKFADDDGNLTLYSTMVPSSMETIGGVSYVVTDEEGLREMLSVIEQGGDPNTVDTYGAKGSTLSR